MICPYCGQNHTDPSVFCPVTGKKMPLRPIEAAQRLVEPSPASRTITRPAGAESWGWYAIGLLGLILISIGGWMLLGDTMLAFLPRRTSSSTQFVSVSQAISTQAVVAVTDTLLPSATSLPDLPTATVLPSDTATLTPTPTSTFSPTPTVTATPSITPPGGPWVACPNSYLSRLHIGDQAYVAFDPPLPNRVRSQPSASADIIGYLEPGEEVEILAGPRCADHWVWWRVRSLRTSLKGWTSEGDMEDYWLVPLLKDQPSRITDDRGVPMALVPAGPFTMGNDPEVGLNECRSLYLGGKCDRSDFTDKQPVHIVSLNSFYIDIYEVTNALYAQCVAEGACQLPTKTRYFNDSQYADHPVIYIRWQDAQTLCQWRTARLPTEAEWEKTARGTDGLIYPWGDRFDGSRGNFCDRNCEYDWANSNFDDGYANTAPVGSYPDGISPYGVFDLVGNVWEWVAD